MAITSRNPDIVRVSQKGQATIPQELREKFGIEAPGEVFVYEEGGRIIIEPIPSADELHGIHAGGHEPGEITEKARTQLAEDERREDEKLERLRPSRDE
jgi:AbrB family looped-hinge helix DNA binding protein